VQLALLELLEIQAPQVQLEQLEQLVLQEQLALLERPA
jgi:hypothetical protein